MVKRKEGGKREGRRVGGREGGQEGGKEGGREANFMEGKSYKLLCHVLGKITLLHESRAAKLLVLCLTW